jgi:histidyl-tRNA synthetase
MEHYAQVKSHLDALHIHYVEDPLLVRGLDYYCRTAFELESVDLGAQRAIAGGGRYDGLAEAIGWDREVPGVGFAAGMERLFLALQNQSASLPEVGEADVYIVALGDPARMWAMCTARDLRLAGLRVTVDVKGRSMKAQMKEANRHNTRYAVLVGDTEMENGVALLRDMIQGDQHEVAFNNVVGELVGLLMP